MQALSKHDLLNAICHSHLGIPLFYDAYHPMNNVGLERDGKDEHHLESWDYVSWCCRAWLSGFFLMPCVMLHKKILERGDRNWYCKARNTWVHWNWCVHTQEKSCNRNGWHWWSNIILLRDGMPKRVRKVQSVPDRFSLRKTGIWGCLDLHTSKISSINRQAVSL